jgi:hypothetical protein
VRALLSEAFEAMFFEADEHRFYTTKFSSFTPHPGEKKMFNQQHIRSNTGLPTNKSI